MQDVQVGHVARGEDGRVGFVTRIVNGMYYGFHLLDSKPWQSRDPEFVAASIHNWHVDAMCTRGSTVVRHPKPRYSSRMA